MTTKDYNYEEEEEEEEQGFDLTVTLNVEVMAHSYEEAVDWLENNLYSNIRSYEFDIE